MKLSHTMKVNNRFVWILICLSLGKMSCSQKEAKNQVPKAKKVHSKSIAFQTSSYPQLLSEYPFFETDLAQLKPKENVLPYSVNMPLFSNYAAKDRFIYLPNENTMQFHSTDPFAMETGTILIKTFSYPYDKNNPQIGRQLLETRLLIKEDKQWVPLNYIWNKEQTEAKLNFVGKNIPVQWKDGHGKTKKINYIVPNINQCKNCHNRNNVISPIGTTAAQLNKQSRKIYEGRNQLDHFKAMNRLTHFTNSKETFSFPSWDIPQSGNTEQRARAYLDANCAHCHSTMGSAKNSGLFLNYHQKDKRARGIFKPPVAAGKGSGNLNYDIVPGHPEESILIYRIKSNDPAIRMPELGRSIVHEEGLSLLTTYIRELTKTTSK